MRRAAALSVLWQVLAVAQSFDTASYRDRAPVIVSSTAGLQTLRVDAGTHSRSRSDLADVRLVADGKEVPYFIERVAGSIELVTLQPEIIDKEVVDGPALRLTLDTGGRLRHSRVEFSTPRTNFRQRVRVETSPDNRTWAAARNDGYIFDFSQDDRQTSVLTVDYPMSTRRYVRFTIDGFEKTSDVTAASMFYREEKPPEWEQIATLSPQRTEDLKTKTSTILFDLGKSGLPHERLRLHAGEGSFHRAVDLESSADMKVWTRLAHSTIFQIPGEQHLIITFGETDQRYLKLIIYNADNPPVPIPSAAVDVMRRVVKFQNATQWLYTGRPDARAPEYDLRAIVARQGPLSESAASLGAWEHNPAYVPPQPPEKPWTERHPNVLPAVLAIAIAGMGFVTVRMLMKVRRSAS